MKNGMIEMGALNFRSFIDAVMTVKYWHTIRMHHKGSTHIT